MTIYYFLGGLGALLLTIVLILDLERKRRRLRHIALRLEQITSGRVRSRVRHVCGLTLSSLMYEQLIRQLHEQIAAVEQENGIEPGELKGRDWYLMEGRLRQLQERVERLAGVLTP